jgi:hypothetical protein
LRNKGLTSQAYVLWLGCVLHRHLVHLHRVGFLRLRVFRPLPEEFEERRWNEEMDNLTSQRYSHWWRCYPGCLRYGWMTSTWKEISANNTPQSGHGLSSLISWEPDGLSLLLKVRHHLTMKNISTDVSTHSAHWIDPLHHHEHLDSPPRESGSLSRVRQLLHLVHMFGNGTTHHVLAF